ncbi:MAG: polyketide synthase, partial [Desulfobacterales bacterium]|nr:polyketide synthase [Desulfobacterales bacterium]
MKNDLKKTGQTPTTERVLLALEEAAKKLEEVRKKESEPIAIIGMGCRLPGGADDPASFWRLLEAGVDAISETPPDRWDVDALHDPDPDAPGKICTRFGGFLSDVAGFDHRFFGVSPMEALSMDPQQRLLLEVSCEAAENAGLPLETLKGSRTGVFVGITTQDYSRVLTRGDDFTRCDDFTRIDAWHGPGNTLNAAAGRLSETLGLQGPGMAADTACSSSLAAIHLACRSLRSGEIDLALAGGVNLILSPEAGITLSRARMLAPDGRCKTFDDAA